MTTIAQAFQNAKKKVEAEGKEVSFEITDLKTHEYSNPEQVPRMYRAQVEGRCSLQFAGDRDQDVQNWVAEWVDPISDRHPEPRYQRQEPQLGWDGSVYRLKIEFPWRVCSNCGTDSILRPVLGKDGIPFFPGSSIKGLFRQLLNSDRFDSITKQKIKEYCGDEEKMGRLRFHGAYPIGDWASTQIVTDQQTGTQEARYRMVDVLHPQQSSQVEGSGKASAYTLITLFAPSLVFELSHVDSCTEDEWQAIAGLLRRALSQGIGGKTSTGYGLWVIPKQYARQFRLKGVGVSSLLRNNEPEFRLNTFKACLRGHASRLLAGVSGDSNFVKKQIETLFGHTGAPGYVQLYWDWKPKNLEITKQGRENTAVYRVKGDLNLDIDRKQVSSESDYKKHLTFMELVFKFAYVMGGFGKSWRRIWHKGPETWEKEFPSFLPSYKTRAIGCHWQYTDSFELEAIQTRKDVEDFLKTAYEQVQNYISVTQTQCVQSWRESWNLKRVSVFCSEPVIQSSVIEMFHKDDAHPFKTTPAICGKSKAIRQVHGRNKEVLAFHFSSVWHRMLPIGQDNAGRKRYLEIVTVFHGDRSPWRRNGEDQLHPFVNQLTQNCSMELAWGTPPPA